MARLLKQSTAFTFRIGPFVDATDGVTAETGLTIAQADIQISKNGGAFAQTSASPTTTHDADGWYQCPLTATDTGTLGPLTVQIVMSGAAPVWEHFMVVPANVYDSLIGGSDTLNVDVTQFGGSNGTFSSGRPEVNTTHAAGTAWASGAIVSGALASGALDAIRDRIVQRTVLRGTVSTSSTTTSITTSAMSPATSVADQLKGRIVIFDHDTTTAALRGQATDITASSASATPTLTVTALTNSPASGDTFTIV